LFTVVDLWEVVWGVLALWRVGGNIKPVEVIAEMRQLPNQALMRVSVG
jgi:hypothetical protein